MGISRSGGFISATRPAKKYGIVTVDELRELPVPFPSQQTITTTGSGTFTVPDNVTSISAVLVGAGGGGYNSASGGGGGGGGALVYINNVPVTPGQQIPLTVGVGGASSTSSPAAGGDSEIKFVEYAQSKSVSTSTTPYQVVMKPDGTKMYVLSYTNSTVDEYTLSTAWDLSTATGPTSFSVSAQQTNPIGLEFNNDGTIMQVIGGTYTISQYFLSTPWAVSSAAFNHTTPAIGSSSIGITWSEDGTKLYAPYLVTTSNFGVYTYAAYEVYRYTQGTNASCIGFKPDGTAMYVLDSNTDTVYQYSLSTAWDIKTASYASKSLVFSAYETTPFAFAFGNNGTKIYGIGQTGDDVNEYNLSTAWDVSTATYSQVFSVATYEGTPSLIGFNPDGTKMYVAGTTRQVIMQYNLSTAWNVSTATLPTKANWVGMIVADGGSVSVATQDAAPNGVFFKPDGTSMYIIGQTSDSVHQYTLSTAWNVSTATYASKSISIAAKETTPTGVFFKPDGLQMYIVGSNSDSVHQYTLSTAWDVSTATFTRTYSVVTQDGAPTDLAFSSDGTKMFISAGLSNNLYQYSLSTAWDISTATYSKSTSAFSTPLNGNITGFTFTDDGMQLLVVGTSNDRVVQAKLGSAFDIGSVTVVAESNVLTETGPNGLALKPDGTKLFVIGASGDAVVSYDMYSGFYVGDMETAPRGQLSFSSDGLTMYFGGTGADKMWGIGLSTAYDVTSANGVRKSFALSGTVEGNPTSPAFDSTGTKMFVIGTSTDRMLSLTLSTAWDVSTASYNIRPYYVDGLVLQTTTALESSGSGIDTLRNVYFKSDGTQMYAVSQGGTFGTSNAPGVRQFALSTPWNVATATFKRTYYTYNEDSAPRGLFIDSSGSRMIVLGSTNSSAYKYTLHSAWNLYLAKAGGGAGASLSSHGAGGVPLFSLDIGNGFAGGSGPTSGGYGNGGAGAGGYAGAGGAGGRGTTTPEGGGNAEASSGGGGGGGGGASGEVGGGGGGVGLLGLLVTGVGAGASTGSNNARGGGGGSGGANGTNGNGLSPANPGNGGLYGGGAAGADSTSYALQYGAQGAIRIIWGTGRSFPSTNTADM